MKTEREKIIDFALTLPQAVADKPFEGDFDTTVLRHGDGGKWFGIVMNVEKHRVGLAGEGSVDVLNVKCDPEEAFILRELYAGIVPAYHMNKRHWVSVILNGSVPEDFTERLVGKSYDLTFKKLKVSKK
jgi:predicted DNA-binding protein (MmcQ/YjbR family)